MAVGLKVPGEILAVPGVRLAGLHAGLKADPESLDLALIELAPGSELALVMTQSHFAAAPVELARRHVQSGKAPRYLLINSGNANAATGHAGIEAARRCCEAVADVGRVRTGQVLPFSTGVIAEALPTDPIFAAIPKLHASLAEDQWLLAARAIMTTDTLPKVASRQVSIGDRRVTITGMAKGSGMIKPNMATMLAFIATDAKLDAALLERWMPKLVEGSFNAISVDGDTSTNDACALMASGASGVEIGADEETFFGALEAVFQTLAQAIIRDAEGATKFVQIEVKGAASTTDARAIAFTIAESPLVKTALFASDPNWGRLIMALGRAPVASLKVERIDLFLGATRLLHQGLPDPDYRESLGQAEMQAEEITIRVELNDGEAECRIWTSDFSYEYVRINAEYRS